MDAGYIDQPYASTEIPWEPASQRWAKASHRLCMGGLGELRLQLASAQTRSLLFLALPVI